MSGEQPSHPSPEHKDPLVRRRFIVEAAAFVIGTITAIVPGAAAIAFIFTPLLKKKSTAAAGDDGYRLVGTTGGLKAGGDPQFFQVFGVKKDAWTTYPSTSLGAVYVRKEEDGQLTCLNARCPHLGCTVTFRPDKDDFLCPCHASSFSINGDRSNQIPPRNLDHLDVEIRNEDEVWVKFQNFRAGREAQIPV
ncbi:ubiquinol-cytochrome c reductase iron-sulfur subunit [Planctomicrobium sp. SH661]|uniref:ubiquinol-cytochrome c reductase iron-sulfur subunit n=1 Tax=Planctomicrobium sp. SH661 TaxID=3448124 RepID=UPI003F5C0A26